MCECLLSHDNTRTVAPDKCHEESTKGHTLTAALEFVSSQYAGGTPLLSDDCRVRHMLQCRKCLLSLTKKCVISTVVALVCLVTDSTELAPWRRAKSNWRQSNCWTSGIQSFNQQRLVKRVVWHLAMTSWVLLAAQRIGNSQPTSAWCMEGLWGTQLPKIDALDLSFSVGCVQRDSQRITINTQLLTLN